LNSAGMYWLRSWAAALLFSLMPFSTSKATGLQPVLAALV
jgi:hypothetical protein